MTDKSVCLVLPVPPSVNGMYRNLPMRGRVKTGAYKKWLAEADTRFLVQKWRLLGKVPVAAPCEVAIRIPAKTRGDASNRIKACEDFLVSRGITGDDRHNWKVSVQRDALLDGGHCIVTVTALEEGE